MTLKHMTIFAEVCQTESFTLAAESLHMTQPAVSLAIKELEDYYGVRLFERMNRKIYITDTGRQLLNYAKTIINQFSEAENTVCNADSYTTLRIGSNVSVGIHCLIPTLQYFASCHPSIHVTSVVGNSKYIEQLLIKNAIDIGIIDNISISPHLHSDLLYVENMTIVCGTEYKRHLPDIITLPALTQEQLLLREKGSGLREIVESEVQLAGLQISPAIESLSMTVLIEAAVHNLGILIIPEVLVQRQLSEGTLHRIQITNIFFTRNYYITYHQNKFVTKPMELFIQRIHYNAK